MYYVIKNKNRPYDCYWNAEQGKWVGLLQADMLTTKDVAIPEDGELILYSKVISGK